MVKVRLYVEGGGDSRSLHIKCREGFRKLLERAGFKGRMPATKACGGRTAAYDDFKTALESAAENECPILLVDSEAVVETGAWEHLQIRDGWQRPPNTDDDQAQLMVQCMETWIVADRTALRTFFGQCLRDSALPAAFDLEAKSNEDIQDSLADATRACGVDRKYRKGRRSFEPLSVLDPDVLREHLPHFGKLCEALTSRLAT